MYWGIPTLLGEDSDKDEVCEKLTYLKKANEVYTREKLLQIS